MARKKISKNARLFIANKIKKNFMEGKPLPQSIAIAYSQARKKGYDIPAKRPGR